MLSLCGYDVVIVDKQIWFLNANEGENTVNLICGHESYFKGKNMNNLYKSPCITYSVL